MNEPIKQFTFPPHNPHPNNQIVTLLDSTVFPSHLKTGQQNPILNKIQSSQTSFYCGYSNGIILQYGYPSDSNNHKLTLLNIQHPYQNMDVIDIDKYSKDSLLVCTHSEITLMNMVKNKRICLKGHQETPIAVSSHPISPLVVSVSNLVIQHDLRMQKPILVNYITPPVYDIKFFSDGQFYFLSGQPCRVGKDKWMRTLQNGIGTVSMNSKYLLTNDMNSNITFWDWKKSQKLRILKGIQNTETYQPIHLKAKNQIHSQVLFLQDNGSLLHHDLITNKTTRQSLFNPQKQDNWKSQISSQIDNTRHLIVYQHQKTEIKCYLINS